MCPIACIEITPPLNLPSGNLYYESRMGRMSINDSWVLSDKITRFSLTDRAAEFIQVLFAILVRHQSSLLKVALISSTYKIQTGVGHPGRVK